METGQETISSYDYRDNAGGGAYDEEDALTVLTGHDMIFFRTRAGPVASMTVTCRCGSG